MFLQRIEAGKAFQMIRESSRQNVATIIWTTSTLSGKVQSIDIPVDSVTQRITFAFSVDTKGSQLVLRHPSGRPVGQGSSRTEDTELNCGRILTVTKPDAGIWHAELSGTGTFWLEALAQSDIYFISAEFVREGGRPGHEGLFRIQGQPLIGSPGTLRASLSATSTGTAEFYLVNERGEILRKLRMKKENSDREFLEYLGSVDPPAMPFRLAVLGRDLAGKQYQRFFAPLFHAESVEVSSKLDFDELSAASTNEAAFAVRNLGPARKFKVTVTDTRRLVSRVDPRELSLRPNQSGIVHVSLTVPPATTSGIGDDLVVVAASLVAPATSNSSVVHLSVSNASGGQRPR
jgi:von Willebrand factor A domain-containing protein 7